MFVNDILSSAEKIVTASVQMVNQTFVDVMKDKGQFDKQAMTAAFQSCRENILALLSDEAKALISAQFGNLDLWIKTKIEANVRNEKLI